MNLITWNIKRNIRALAGINLLNGCAQGAFSFCDSLTYTITQIAILRIARTIYNLTRRRI